MNIHVIVNSRNNNKKCRDIFIFRADNTKVWSFKKFEEIYMRIKLKQYNYSIPLDKLVKKDKINKIEWSS